MDIMNNYSFIKNHFPQTLPGSAASVDKFIMRFYKSPTWDVDAGHSVRVQDQVFVTVAHDAVFALVTFSALAVAAVLNGADDHLPVALHGCTDTRHKDGEQHLCNCSF